MKAIKTKYHAPTDHKPARISARDQDKNKVMLPWDYSLDSESNHQLAARTLCKKMGWGDTIVGGGYNNSMFWVFYEIS